MGFAVGDRVRIKIGAVGMSNVHTDNMKKYEGTSGTIQEVNKTTGEHFYRVFGFYWAHKAVKPAIQIVPVPSPTWRIIIEGNENTSRAKYVVGKKVIKETSANRYHKDKHDPAMAARALIGKMFPDPGKPDDPPKYFAGKAVCVRPSKFTRLEKGKIYDFSLNDGRGENRNGVTILCSPAKDIEEINRRTDSEFIEIKE